MYNFAALAEGIENVLLIRHLVEWEIKTNAAHTEQSTIWSMRLMLYCIPRLVAVYMMSRAILLILDLVCNLSSYKAGVSFM
jgi:hypothetical protein